MDGQELTYEQFKADILQWKDAHREEYTHFAKMMADGNETQYLAVCRAIFRQLPGIKKEWQLSWCDDSTDAFSNIDLHFKENAVPKQIVELYRKQREEDAAPPPSSFWGRMRYIFRQSLRKRCVTLSAPLVLSWLYYGKSFEAMVDMVNRQAGHPKAGNAERMGCSIVVRQIIEVSIKNGFRTQEDWDSHFAMKDAIEKGGIGEWALQFPDLPSLKSESAIRQAVGFLKAAKHVIKDGKDQMAPLIESDENRELYRTLAAEIREIVADDEAETAAG